MGSFFIFKIIYFVLQKKKKHKAILSNKSLQIFQLSLIT